MELKYNLTVDELMEFFYNQNNKGFTEQEIQSAEQTIGAKLPEVYRSFLLKYGEKDIHIVFDNLFSSLKRICTTYEMIHEILEDLEEDFEEAVKDGTQEKYADNPYFSLWHMPEEDWHTITQNYVLLGCDREGITYTGYLLQDLLDKKPEPPIYLSWDDDIIEFRKWTDNTESFLIEMICETAYNDNMSVSDDYNPKKRMSVKEIFSHMNVDIDDEQFQVFGHVGTCLDIAAQKLYIYFDYETFQRLFYVCMEDLY